MTELPDFLKLPEDAAAREEQRQNQLRMDFNSRAKLSPVEMEAARAQAITPTLETAVRQTKDPGERLRLKDQLAEAYAAQGWFLKAARTAKDTDLRLFYRKAGDAVFNAAECSCTARVEQVGTRSIRLPKYRVIREVNSLALGQFGYLVECNKCRNWCFIGNNPLPDRTDPATFDLKKTPNDLELLKK